MNTASLELCKELYKLSRWTSPELHGHYKTTESASVLRLPTEEICPAYDLGYLLRKLPSEISIEKMYNHEDGVVYYAEANTGFESADTPEDAACKLAIELFRQGILKKE